MWFLRYGSQRTEGFVILGHFLPFYSPPLTTQIFFEKIKKNVWRSFYTSVPKFMIIWYTVPEIWRVTDVVCIFHFGLFLALLPPAPTPPTAPINDLKIENKVPGNIITLHMCTRNYDHMVRGSWDMVRDRRTDERTEKVTYRGASFSFISLQHLGNIHPAFISSYNPGQHFSDKL